jgi:hypothetical protein
MGIVAFLILVVAIEHLTDILVNVDLLEVLRSEFESGFPTFAKLARCRFCQAFWLSGLACLVSPGLLGLSGDVFLRGVDVLLSWLVMHKAVVLLTEVNDRFLGRAPSSHNVILHIPSESESES